jgi:hypothetical protein
MKNTPLPLPSPNGAFGLNVRNIVFCAEEWAAFAHWKRLRALGKPTGMMTFDKRQMVLFRDLILRSTKDNHLCSGNGGCID